MALTEKHREEISEAVARALEDGATKQEVRNEFEYCLTNFEEE